MMFPLWLAAMALAPAPPAPIPVRPAGTTYSDALAKCMVAKTSERDRVALVQWIFVALSAHPGVAQLARVDAATRVEYDRGMAGLMTRLTTVDCRAETVAALKNEGPTALPNGFRVLGEVAMQSIASDPAVDKSLGAFAAYLDDRALGVLIGEAGGTATPPAR